MADQSSTCSIHGGGRSTSTAWWPVNGMMLMASPSSVSSPVKGNTEAEALQVASINVESKQFRHDTGTPVMRDDLESLNHRVNYQLFIYQ